MAGPEVKRQATEDGVVHWIYPMAGQLTVCGILGSPMRSGPWTNAPPTCVRCIALVQADKQGDAMPWVAPDPKRRLG